MERYTTLAGEVLEYETPAPEVARFLARATDAAHDPRVTESAMVELVYGPENPLLEQGKIPGHGLVTQETFANPVYHVLLDLLGRKRVQLGTLDPSRAEVAYTLTVAEAAERLGVHQSAVRQAIQAHKLDAVKRGTILLLNPASVESYRVSRRGPKPRAEAALQVVVGNDERGSFRIKVVGGELEVSGREDRRVTGVVRSFERAAVISGGDGSYRLFELEPAESEERIEFGPFHVIGRFRVASKENNARRATEQWQSISEVGRPVGHNRWEDVRKEPSGTPSRKAAGPKRARR